MRTTSNQAAGCAARAMLAALSLVLTTGALGAESVPNAGKPASTTTGFWQEFHTRSPAPGGGARSGEQVYEYRCKGCHGRNTQGAPLPGDRDEWRQRAKHGMEVLMIHTVRGYKEGLMPPRGGCRNCSDAELKAAVLYMMNAEPDAGLRRLLK
jgi:cytochrome c5